MSDILTKISKIIRSLYDEKTNQKLKSHLSLLPQLTEEPRGQILRLAIYVLTRF